MKKTILLHLSVLCVALFGLQRLSLFAQTTTVYTAQNPIAGVSALACPEGLKINEIRPFAEGGPAGDFLFAFVELYNAGDQEIPLEGWLLAGAGGDVVAELPNWSLPPSACLLIYFGEGKDDNEFSDRKGAYYTQGNPAVFQRTGDEVALYFENLSEAGIRDFAAWSETGDYTGGKAYDHALAAGIWPAGQFVNRADADPLASIGLLPDGNDNNLPADWLEFDWGSTFIGLDPGGPNSPHLWPADEVVSESPADTFQWRNVWNAAGYRLQLSFTTGFEKPVLDTFLSETRCRLELPEARYYWRVIPILPGCALLPPPHRVFYVEDVAKTDAAPPKGKKPKKSKYLGVKRILQRKDTRMLCISDETLPDWQNPVPPLRRPGCTEPAGRQGPWDGPHPTRHALRCNHCNMYCARAAIAMINHYRKGDLSQDRISYQIHKDFFNGPEQDLGHHRPVYGQPDEITPAYQWALGGAAVQRGAGPLTYQTIVDEISAGRPILVLIPGHYVVINGYRTRPAGNRIYISDPWPSSPNGWRGFNWLNAVYYWTFQGKNVKGAKEEATIKTDADSDGVVDFDEQNRFCSHFQKPDTDLDEVPDKKDIRSYTFHDVDVGHDNDAPNFPDIDGDGTYAECDCDSDNDADFDGGEDINGDGKSPVGAGETDVFNPDDPVVHIATDKLVYLPGENVRLFGGTEHQNSTYPYEIKSDCPDLVNGQPLGETGKVITDNKGNYQRDLGGFAPGVYLVVLDILKDKRYQEPDNWDPWTCFVVIECFILIDPFIIPASSPTAADGAIDLTVSGGTGPYTFEWSNGATTEDLFEIPAGIYTVTVISADGCIQTAEIEVPTCFMELQFAVQPVTIPGGSNGAIDLTVLGGTPPYAFLWSNGATTEDLFDVPEGPYFVEVRDANGCTQFGETFVPGDVNLRPAQSRGTLAATGSTGFRIYPNPARETAVIQFLQPSAALRRINVFDPFGRLLYTSETADSELRVNTSGWPAGVYRVDALGSAGKWAGVLVVVK